MKNKLQYGLLLLLLATVLPVLQLKAQDRSKLEKQRKELEKTIKFTQQELAKVGESKKESLSQLELLLSQIDTRQKVINNINREIKILDGSISETEEIITALEGDLKELKQQYGEMLYYAYKNRSAINDLVFIFSAQSFNDAFKRMRYLQQYGEFRKRQAELIESTKTTLNHKLADLEKKRGEQRKLLNQQLSQRNQLKNEKTQKDELVGTLLQKEKQLNKEIKQAQKDASALTKKIEELIQKEIAERKKLTDYDIKLSGKFAENKGRLPMPVDQGTITKKFGQYPHPVYKEKVMINNTGIDIRTSEKALVRAVFDGEVKSVMFNPIFQNLVLVKHGDYYTVYSKLATVDVKTGDKLVTGQSIGTVYTDADNATTEVHFELWQGMNKLNPALWIYAQ